MNKEITINFLDTAALANSCFFLRSSGLTGGDVLPPLEEMVLLLLLLLLPALLLSAGVELMAAATWALTCARLSFCAFKQSKYSPGVRIGQYYRKESTTIIPF
jgi:hypothetical protein